MKLKRATTMLRKLLAMFRARRIRMPRSVRIEHREALDARNKKHPRQIAQVELGRCFFLRYAVIEASKAIERLHDHDLCGVLLHELAHIATEDAEGDLEIAADTLLDKKFLDAGYSYVDSENMDGVPLKKIETVWRTFILENDL